MGQVIGFNQKLSSKDEREYFIVSDLHFFHKGVLGFCPDTRPWKDVDEMNEGLIDHWNSVVSTDDVVFCLGDFSFKAKEATQSIIERFSTIICGILMSACLNAEEL